MTKWTKKKCHAIALNYNIRKDFKIGSHAAYSAAYKHNWMNDVCSHMKRIGNKMFRCIYVYEFSDNSAYIGLTYNLEKRNINRKSQNNDAVTKHIKQTNIKPTLKQLTEYLQVDTAVELENNYINFYRKNGWNILNSVNGGALGASKKKWTVEKCHDEALKYESRSEFYYKSNKIYAAACRYGWLNEICAHMSSKRISWTIEICENDALKYKTRNEYSTKSHNSYIAAHRHGWLDEICAHMKPKRNPPNYWTYEKCKEVVSYSSNKTEFFKKYSGAYDKARDNNWIHLLFK